MPGPDDRRTELLVLCTDARGAARFTADFAEHGMATDVVGDVSELRTAFFARGGHDVLVMFGDVPPPLAERAVRTLRGLDPDLRVVAFGQQLARATLPGTVTRIPAFHPTSRAGIGALLRVVRGMS